MDDDDYRELLEKAEDAIQDLLEESRPDAYMSLRFGYREVCRELDRGARARGDADTKAEWARARAEQQERQGRWRTLPKERREALVLQVLADDGLRLGDLTARINRELVPDGGFPAVWESSVRYVVKGMVDAGQLQRTADPMSGGRVRYRYSRKRGLAGPIADLERAYRDDETDETQDHRD